MDLTLILHVTSKYASMTVSNLYRVLNASLHICAATAAIALIFIYKTSQNETHIVNSILGDNLQEGIHTKLTALSSTQKASVVDALTRNSDTLHTLANAFDESDREQALSKHWANQLALAFAVAPLLVFALCVAVIYMCKSSFKARSFDFSSMLRHVTVENGIIFIIVGTIEFLFFSELSSKITLIDVQKVVRSALKTFSTN